MTELQASPDWLGLRGQVFAVTGAASGIGEAIATALAQQGANVALLDSHPQRGDAVRQKLEHLPGKRVAVACDVSCEAQVKEAALSVRSLLGSCDGLVNAAGILRPAGLADISLEQWQTQLNVNLTGYLLCAREFAHDMRAPNAAASSISARFPGAFRSRGAVPIAPAKPPSGCCRSRLPWNGVRMAFAVTWWLRG